MDVIKRCQKCGRYMTCDETSTIHKAFNCNGILEQINISCDDMYIIEDISTDKDFIQAMIDLKEKDIIEYNLKMSQFKSQLEQQKSSKAQNNNRPKCPACGSTNIEKISATKKVVGGAMFGLFSSDVRNTMHCKNCGTKW